MKPPIRISQTVSVSLDTYDNGLRSLIRAAVGAPRGASVHFSEDGVEVTWDRNKTFHA